MRTGAFASTLILVACSVAPSRPGIGLGNPPPSLGEEATTGETPEPSESPGGSSEGGGGSSTGGSTGWIGPLDPETSSSGGGSDGGSSGGGGEGESESGSGDPLPPDGAWDDCLFTDDCDAGFGCLNNGPEPTEGVCTSECAAAGDPSQCPTAPLGGTVDCISLGGTHICVLDCGGGLTCPAGMTCIDSEDDNGAVSVCL